MWEWMVLCYHCHLVCVYFVNQSAILYILLISTKWVNTWTAGGVVGRKGSRLMSSPAAVRLAQIIRIIYIIHKIGILTIVACYDYAWHSEGWYIYRQINYNIQQHDRNIDCFVNQQTVHASKTAGDQFNCQYTERSSGAHHDQFCAPVVPRISFWRFNLHD